MEQFGRGGLTLRSLYGQNVAIRRAPEREMRLGVGPNRSRRNGTHGGGTDHMTGSQTLQNLRSRMLRLPGLAIIVVAVLILGVVVIMSIRSAVPTAPAATIIVDSTGDVPHATDLPGHRSPAGRAPSPLCTEDVYLRLHSAPWPHQVGARLEHGLFDHSHQPRRSNPSPLFGCPCPPGLSDGSSRSGGCFQRSAG